MALLYEKEQKRKKTGRMPFLCFEIASTKNLSQQ